MRALIPITLVACLSGIAYLAYDLRTPDRSSASSSSSPSSGPAHATLAGSSRTEAHSSAAHSRTPHLVASLSDGSLHLSDHIEAIRALPTDLTSREFQALIDLLHQAPPSGITVNIWATVQNEIMEVLRQKRFDLPGYAPAMAQLVTTKEADPVMRDYAAQHLVGYLNTHAAALPADQLSDSLTSLFSVLDGQREAQDQVTGTTLMALCDFHTHHPQLLSPHRPQLLTSITRLLDLQHHVSLPNRISAIQAAGRLNLPETLPTIRALATSSKADSKVHSSLRLSSVATLGYFADPQDHRFLADLAQSSSTLRYAAQTALKNYDK